MQTIDIEIDEVLKTFLAETEEQLSEIEEALVALEQQPDDGEAIQSIFRAAHTLKGNAASLGFPGVAELAHSLEDLLDRIRTNAIPVGGPVVTLLLRAVDALRFLVPAAAEGQAETHPGQKELLADIAAICGALAPGRGVLPTGFDDDTVTHAIIGPNHQTLRVDLGRLDRMLDLSGEIAVAQGRLAQVLRGCSEEILEAHRDANRIFMELQEEILRARMVPLGPTFRQQTRTVRDAAQAAQKQVRLEIEGGDVEVDATLVESLRGPITHMVRNAIDHGIESPAVRAALGKDPRGRIRLKARHESGGVVIELEDDGAGLDKNRIAAKARETGLAAHPEAMTEQELLRLVFEPGFSTSDTVTELSGRGIGMDVVRKNVEALRGSVDLRSVAGQGATFSIKVPLTVAIIQGFIFEVGEETYVIRLDAIAECVDLPESKGRRERTGVLNLRGEVVPFIRLRQVFGLLGQEEARESLIVVKDKERSVALAVDSLVGESQIVIKPFNGALRDLPGLAGSTILGSGRVALILDVPALLEAARTER